MQSLCLWRTGKAVYSTPVKAIRFFLLYFLLASTVAAVLAYPAYLLAGPDLIPFEKWVTRLALLILILGIFPARRLLQLSASDLGFNRSWGPFLLRMGAGFIIGMCILMMPVTVLLMLGAREMNIDGSSALLPLLITALLSGLGVALIEETLFRGLFMAVVQKHHRWPAAVIASSIVYALVHFMRPENPPAADAIQAWSGFVVMGQAYLGVLNAGLDDLLALFTVGVILAWTRVKTGSLAMSMGMHASWVFLIKLIKEHSDKNPASEWSFLVGHYDGIIGWGVFAWLSLVIAGLLCMTTTVRRA